MATKRPSGGPKWQRGSRDQADFNKLMRDIEEFSTKSGTPNTIRGRLESLKKSLEAPHIRVELRRVAESIEEQSTELQKHLDVLTESNEALVDVYVEEREAVVKRIDAIEAYLVQEIPKQAEETMKREAGKSLAKVVQENSRKVTVENRKENEKNKQEVMETIADEMATVRDHLKKLPDNKELLKLNKWLTDSFKAVKEQGARGFKILQTSLKETFSGSKRTAGFVQRADGFRQNIQRIVQETSHEVLERVGLKVKGAGSKLVEFGRQHLPTGQTVKGLVGRVAGAARGGIAGVVSTIRAQAKDGNLLETLLHAAGGEYKSQLQRTRRERGDNAFQRGFANIVDFFKGAARRAREAATRWLAIGATITAGVAVLSGAATEALGLGFRWIDKKIESIKKSFADFREKYVTPVVEAVKRFFEPIMEGIQKWIVEPLGRVLAPLKKWLGIKDEPEHPEGPPDDRSFIQKMKDFVGYGGKDEGESMPNLIDPKVLMNNLGRVTGVNKATEFLGAIGEKANIAKRVPELARNNPVTDTLSSAYAMGRSAGDHTKSFIANAFGNVKNFFRTKDSNVDIDGLAPEVRERFFSMLQEYRAMGGKRIIQVNSAKRSREEQAALYAKDPRKAAPPGKSDHEFGRAIDIQTSDANELARMGLLEKYGFVRDVPGEAWHLSQKGLTKMLSDKDWSAGDYPKRQATVSPPITNIVTPERVPQSRPVPQRMNIPREPQSSDTIPSLTGNPQLRKNNVVSPAIIPSASTIPFFSYSDPKFMMANTGVLSGR
jgi:hypothetical protein